MKYDVAISVPKVMFQCSMLHQKHNPQEAVKLDFLSLDPNFGVQRFIGALGGTLQASLE